MAWQAAAWQAWRRQASAPSIKIVSACLLSHVAIIQTTSLGGTVAWLFGTRGAAGKRG